MNVCMYTITKQEFNVRLGVRLIDERKRRQSDTSKSDD